MIVKTKLAVVVGLSGLISLMSGANVVAQENASVENSVGELEEIVVTARRRTESNQDIPIAVSVLGADDLNEMQINDFGEVGQSVPNLDVQRQFGSGSVATFVLRGQATGALNLQVDSRVGLYLDDVYLSRPSAALFGMADVCQLEVLRGPQGTLFGRNSTGGAISFTSCDPAGEWGGQVEVGFGGYEQQRYKATINTPRVNGFAMKLTALHEENEGYVDNLSAGTVTRFAEPFGDNVAADTLGLNDTDAFNVVVHYDNDGPLTAYYRFDYTDKESSQLGTQLLGEYGSLNPSFNFGPTGGAPSAVSTDRLDELPLDFLGTGELEVSGHSLTISYDISDTLRFKSVSSFRTTDEHTGGNDIDGNSLRDTGIPSNTLGIPGPVFNLGATQEPFAWISSIGLREHDQLAQEFQLFGETDNFEWIAGLYYFQEEGDFNVPVFLFVPFAENGVYEPGVTNASIGAQGDYQAGIFGSGENESIAAYLHGSYQLNDAWNIDVGLRRTKDSREEFIIRSATIVDQSADADESYTDWDVSVGWAVHDGLNLYGKVSTGHLSGGVLGGLEFGTEEILSYELGMKSDLLNNRLRLNAAIFHSEVEDVQVTLFTPAAGTVIINQGDADQSGFELELKTLLADSLELTVNYGYLDEKLIGERRSFTPENTGYIGLKYVSAPLGNGALFSVRADGSYKSKSYGLNCPPSAAVLETGCGAPAFDTSALDDAVTQDANWQIGARVSLQDIPLGKDITGELSLWVKNLLDTDELEFPRDLSNGTVVGTFQVPRTYGANFTVNF